MSNAFTNTTVIFSAYMDSRFGFQESKIRLIGFRLCKNLEIRLYARLKTNKPKSAAVNMENNLNGTTFELLPKMFRRCPWSWAPGKEDSSQRITG